MTEEELDLLHNRYRRARKAYCEKDQAVTEIGRILRQIAKALVPESYGKGIGETRTPLNDRDREQLEKMPSAQDVTDVMDAWRVARDDLRTVWDAIPSEERKHCQSLPDNLPFR